MAKLRSFTWMVSPKSMTSLLGAEYNLLKKAGDTVLRKFYVSAVLIVIIMIVSACSIFYAVDLLVHNYAVEILLSVFISFLFGCMYIFLTNTFAKDARTRKSNLASFSNITRIGFVMFMAFVLSKPIEIWILKSRMEEKVSEYRLALIAEHLSEISQIYQADINDLQKERLFQEMLAKGSNSSMFAQDINEIDRKIESLRHKESSAIQLTRQRIEGSDFFVYRVNQASKTEIAWLCCTFIVILFCLPGFLIYSISSDNEYFKLKKDQETNLILQEYFSFKEKYKQIFKQKYGISCEFYTVFEDPPFNTKRREEHKEFKNQDDFFRKFLKNQG